MNSYLYSDSGSNLLAALLRTNAVPMVFAVFVSHYSRDKLYRNLTGLPQPQGRMIPVAYFDYLS